MSKARDFYYLAKYGEASLCPVTKENLPYIIGSMTFLGQHDEARLLYEQQKSQLTDRTKNIVLFHLGLSYTRTSDYSKAKEYFLLNLRRVRNHSSTAEGKFFVFQGLAFYRFFFSKHLSSLYFAKKALQQVLSWKEAPPLLAALVYDILGHNHHQLGQRAKGEKAQKKAMAITKAGGLENLYKEFKASSTIYATDYSIDFDKSIKNLKGLLKSTPESNDYTSSEIVLQISKLYLLKGQYKRAHEYLLSNFSFIYKNENKRKLAKLNTLLAQILLQKGQYMECLGLLRVAKDSLSKEVDSNLLLPILGLEQRVLNNLNQDTVSTQKRIEFHLLKTEKSIPHNIQGRHSKNPLNISQEDEIGVLLNASYQKQMDVLDRINQAGAFHFIHSFCEKRTTSKAIFIHPQNKGFYLLNEDEVIFKDLKLSKNQLSIISLLITGTFTKAEIIKNIWGYEYDPLRHDHLVYTAIRRLRLAFEDYAHWIQNHDESYNLVKDVEIIGLKKEEVQNVKTVEYIPEDLNFRQLQVLEGVLPEFFSSQNLVQHFQVTRMTAYRDLEDLLQKGYLLKTGKGKGTRYHLRA